MYNIFDTMVQNQDFNIMSTLICTIDQEPWLHIDTKQVYMQY